MYALVAQLDRASDYGSEGREFESSPARQKKKGHPHGCPFSFVALPEDLNLFAIGKKVR